MRVIKFNDVEKALLQEIAIRHRSEVNTALTMIFSSHGIEVSKRYRLLSDFSGVEDTEQDADLS